MNSVAEVKKLYSGLGYRSQIWTISLIRRALFESFNLTVLLREAVSKAKKYKFAKQTIEKSVTPLVDEVFNAIIDLKWRENTTNECKLVRQRDQAL